MQCDAKAYMAAASNNAAAKGASHQGHNQAGRQRATGNRKGMYYLQMLFGDASSVYAGTAAASDNAAAKGVAYHGCIQSQGPSGHGKGMYSCQCELS